MTAKTDRVDKIIAQLEAAGVEPNCLMELPENPAYICCKPKGHDIKEGHLFILPIWEQIKREQSSAQEL